MRSVLCQSRSFGRKDLEETCSESAGQESERRSQKALNPIYFFLPQFGKMVATCDSFFKVEFFQISQPEIFIVYYINA